MWYTIIELFSLCALLKCSSPKSSTEIQSSLTELRSKNESQAKCQNYSSSGAWLFYPKTGRCYLKSDPGPGPCGEKMRFYSSFEDELIGACDCDQSSDRLLVYNKQDERCYEIFKRGPCRENYWVTVNEEGKPACTIYPCEGSSVNGNGIEDDMVPYYNNVLNRTECVTVGSESKAFCKDFPYKVLLLPGQRVPTCRRFPSRSVGVQAINRRCSTGTYRAYNGHCQPAFDFDD